MRDNLLVFNAGSSSLKFAAYELGDARALALNVSGAVEELASAARFVVADEAGQELATHAWPVDRAIDHDEALRFVVTWLQGHLAGARTVAAGHRMMLGGPRYAGPVHIDTQVLNTLDALSAMEPSHQPFNVRGARMVATLMPDMPQVACFDSSFHQTMPATARTYALPKTVRSAGIHHWGYHGLSYEYVSERMRALEPAARRVIVAHLGGGSSLCAMLDGRSVETTMGLSGLSGLPMATRSGDIPPDALLYLLRSRQFDIASLEKMLYERSGLLGLSGISGDMRVLQESADPEAANAVKHFVYAMTKYVGAYAAVLGGLDALVFTGGVGEHSNHVRAALCRQLASLGIVLDLDANRSDGAVISTPDSRVCVRVMATNEELMIARHTLAVLDAEAVRVEIVS
jgi:acetate kinase